MKKLVTINDEAELTFYKKAMLREDLKVGDSLTIIKKENLVIYGKVYVDLNSGIDPLLIADIYSRYYEALKKLKDL